MTSTATLDRDKLESARKALRELTAENETMLSSLGTDGDSLVFSDTSKAAFEENLAKGRQLRDTVRLLEDNSDLKDALRAPAGQSVAEMAAFFEQLRGGGSGGSSKAADADVVRGLLNSEPYKAMVADRSYKMAAPFEYKGADLPGVMRRKDIYRSMPGGPGDLANFGGIERDPMVLRAHRRMRVRDLFPVRTTTASVIEFFKVTGLTNNASVVPERVSSAFGVKPQSGLSFTGIAANVRTIAHWEVAHRNVLADEPQLEAIIEDELLYGLQLHEDYQILQGTGTGEDLLGVMNTPGIQSYAKSSGPGTDNMADALRRAATKVILAFYEPTGIAIHPSDWEAIQLSKSTTDTYLFPVTLDFAGTTILWNLPVVPTPAMPQGTALIGSFGAGFQLYDREEGNIRIADQHAGLFIQNAIVVLAEERLALAGKRPESMVKVSLAA